jgi:hypothetical protein
MLGNMDNITIWNRWKDPNDIQSREVFYRHVIPVKCRFKTSIVRTVGGSAGSTSPAIDAAVMIGNSQIVLIPENEEYLPSVEWRELDENEREEFYTLQINDLMALGIHNIEIDQNNSLSSVRDFLMPHVLSINAIQDNTRNNLGKHIRVEGM